MMPQIFCRVRAVRGSTGEQHEDLLSFSPFAFNKVRRFSSRSTSCIFSTPYLRGFDSGEFSNNLLYHLI